MVSQEHRQAMLDAFNDYDLDAGTTPKQMVSMIVKSSIPIITFTEADLPPRGSLHNLALHIMVEPM